ncbi:MAG: MFS transporter, partial [Defluviitaleaceae bacterium]|nr:MFS transporter [Defluviitaleaceae bacterium]
MFKLLLNLKGNKRACIWTEPMWSIPFNLYAPFAAVYMFYLGVLDWQIGLLLTIQGFIKIPISLLAGIITDKLGRRKTLFIFDVVSWGIPVLIWALSQNFWWFLAATIVNSLYPISTASW